MSREEILVLVKYRLEQAQTALDDGRFLMEGGRSPQSIVNRAYYAMFYAANALLATQGLTRSKHTAVHAAFGQHFVKTGLMEPQYLRRLVDAFDARSDADYDAAFVGDPARAEAAVASAKDFVARVEQLLSLGGGG